MKGPMNPARFWEGWFTIVQTGMLVVILVGLVENRRWLSLCLGSLLCATAIVGAYSVFSGEWRLAEKSGERVASLALNSNAFGYGMFLATMSLAYLWTAQPAARPVRRVLLIAGMVAVAMAIWASGSRKAVLAMTLFYPMWIWFCYRKEMLRRFGVFLLVAAAMGGGAVALKLGMADSALGERFGETWEVVTGKRSKGGGLERLLLYREAIQVFIENPVLGIGMGQFVYRSSILRMSHSEYMEVATGSGLPGLILYLSIAVVFWRRCGRIVRWSSDPNEVRLARLFRVCLVVLLLLALGRPNYTSKEYWVFMASLIGYTVAVHRRLLASGQYLPASTAQVRSCEEYGRSP